jgi:hypothetical protein
LIDAILLSYFLFFLTWEFVLLENGKDMKISFFSLK